MFQLPATALPLTAAYLRAKLEGRRDEALRLALEEGLGAGIEAPALQLRMIVPSQHEVGRLWQENRITVAQEHLATSISQLVLSRLYPHLPRASNNGRHALIACIEGELHDLGARIGADFLEMQGFEVRFLGADVPLNRLLQALAEAPPDLLGLSVTMHSHLPTLRASIEQVRQSMPGLPIVVGGGLLERIPNLAEALGVEMAGASADELAAGCRRLLGC